MVLLSKWGILTLPFAIPIACAKFFVGWFAILIFRWFSIDLIAMTSVKKNKCSLEGLFKENSTSGELNHDNLLFFSKIAIEFYQKHHHDKVDIKSDMPIVKNFHLDKSALNLLADLNFFVEIEYNLDHPWVQQVNHKNLIQSVFVKSLPKRISGRFGQILFAIHETEGIHFAEVFGEEWFPSDVMPRIVYGNYNYFTTDYLIFTEDLRGKYFFKGYSPKSISRDEKLKTVETIAKLHASGMAYLRSLPKKEKQEKIDELDRKSTVMYKNSQNTVDILLLFLIPLTINKLKNIGIHQDIIDNAKQFILASNIVAKLKLCVGAEEMLSFVHRDLHFNNIGIAHETSDEATDSISIKLIDWQCCGIGNPLFDLFYMICFTSDLETVDSVESDYLQHYYKCICKELKERKLSLPKQLENYENYLEFYKDATLYFLGWCPAIQLLILQHGLEGEIGNASKNFIQSGAHILMKYDNLKRINKIIGN